MEMADVSRARVCAAHEIWSARRAVTDRQRKELLALRDAEVHKLVVYDPIEVKLSMVLRAKQSSKGSHMFH